MTTSVLLKLFKTNMKILTLCISKMFALGIIDPQN